MSYDLAFWEGPRPRDDVEAAHIFERLWDPSEQKPADDTPPTPAIRALIEALEARWPRDDPAAPWASFPLTDDAHGGTAYVNLVLARPSHDFQFIGTTARRLGIVCFDPQRETML